MTTAAPTLAERRAETAFELEALEREQAVAVLDGKPFDAKRLAECREELSALDGAEAEQSRRDRAAQAAQGVDTRAETRLAMAETMKVYLDAVEAAETAAKAMVEGFKQTQAMAEHLRRQIRTVGGTIPISIEAHETTLQHSRMLATVLGNIDGPCRFGALRWNSVAPIADWTAHAEKYVRDALAPYLEGEN